ncbi:MAG: hypothetical protein QOH08_1361 [Chloroflexota bacterium]|nr:hypothetical protein [Chloroflexota bacterium]
MRAPRAVAKDPASRCRAKFLREFPGGFYDEKYLDWERGYKWQAHVRWTELLGADEHRRLIRRGEYGEVAARAVRIESRTNLLFSFEKMALRDAVKPPRGARAFAAGLFEYLHGDGGDRERFEAWCAVVGSLPRTKTRVLTWPVVTVFGFIARPKVDIFLKPTVTKRAAAAYGFDFSYASRPGWDTYASLRRFASTIRHDLADLRPRDMIDIQSFIWVQGSDEY